MKNTTVNSTVKIQNDYYHHNDKLGTNQLIIYEKSASC